VFFKLDRLKCTYNQIKIYQSNFDVPINMTDRMLFKVLTIIKTKGSLILPPVAFFTITGFVGLRNDGFITIEYTNGDFVATISSKAEVFLEQYLMCLN
jgi:hypothetical protein